MPLYIPKVYFASKVRHAPLWRDLRAGRLADARIVSSWIDDPWLESEASGKIAPPATCAAQWTKDIREAASADFILCYAEQDDIPRLSGTLVEIGAGLARGAQVLLCGGWFPPHWTWTYHPRCVVFAGAFLDDAIATILKECPRRD